MKNVQIEDREIKNITGKQNFSKLLYYNNGSSSHKHSTCWLSGLKLLMKAKCFHFENFFSCFAELHGKVHMAHRKQEVLQL